MYDSLKQTHVGMTFRSYLVADPKLLSNKCYMITMLINSSTRRGSRPVPDVQRKTVRFWTIDRHHRKTVTFFPGSRPDCIHISFYLVKPNKVFSNPSPARQPTILPPKVKHLPSILTLVKKKNQAYCNSNCDQRQRS